MSFSEQFVVPKTSFKKDMAYIGVLLFVVVALMFLNFWHTTVSSKNDKSYIAITGELRILSQTMAKHAASAVDGVPAAFGLLRKSRDEFDSGLMILKNGDAKLSIPASSSQIRFNELLSVEETWHLIKEKTNIILARHELLMALKKIETSAEEALPQMQLRFSTVIELLNKNKAPVEKISLAAKQSILAERLMRNIDKIMQGVEGSEKAAKEFQNDSKLFSAQLDMMRAESSPEIQAIIAEIAMLYKPIDDNINRIADSSEAFVLLHKAAYDIYMGSQVLLDQATMLSRTYTLDSEHRFIGEPTGYMLGATGLLLLVWLGYRVYSDTKESLAITAAQHKSNRAAVWRLLDELANLADGDLTVHTTVGDDITGAIAESVNYAIDALRRLVFTINDTAVQVSSSAQEVQTTARRLAQASENQAGEIVGATATVNAMAASIEEVSGNATESSQVAETSVSIAKSGVSVVQNTIRGMERIRGQIQETSKKIKRLGESTQEIGDIVSLIDDITDQTNILALNASIQAAMAGEAGKGFAVVAEEVQRLAERSSKATRQIEILVNAIQSDTNETVTSMEQTTQEVVLGTKLAKDAGVALEEVENVSFRLAGLIQKISTAAKEQAKTAIKISKTMDIIQEITTQTAAGTHVTAGSIGNLAELAIELRDSVAGFKLPIDRQGRAEDLSLPERLEKVGKSGQVG